MSNKEDLQRFLSAQERDYDLALREIKDGKKRSHWMWYIFPQISGLGFSDMSSYYALKDLKEAEAYFRHPVLGARLMEITKVLLSKTSSDATAIFGSPDDLKLRSSMTLFSRIPGIPSVFQQVLDRYYDGKIDPKTISLLEADQASTDH
jgi:uncharacterized protein (DUF1810 family)